MEFESLIAKLETVGDDETEIKKVFEEATIIMGESGELSEEDLDDVAGGSRETDALKWFLSKTKLGKLTWKGMKIATRGFYDYFKYGDPYRTYSKSEVNEVCEEFDKYYKKLPKWLR